jgi:hypothetical protein
MCFCKIILTGLLPTKLSFMRKFLFLVMCTLLAFSVPVIAQEVVNPGNPPEVGWGFETFATLTALVTVVIPFVVEILKRFVPGAPSLVKQVLSWLVGVAVAFAGWGFGLGFLSGLSWHIVLLYGLGSGLIANGVFDTGIVTYLLGLFGIGKAK